MTKISTAPDATIFMIVSGQSIICYEEGAFWHEPHVISVSIQRNAKGEFYPLYNFKPVIEFNPDINKMKPLKESQIIIRYPAGRQAKTIFAEYLEKEKAKRSGIILTTNQGAPGQMN